MSYEQVKEIITKHLKLTYRFDLNIKKDVHEIPFKFKLNKDKYEKIIPKILNNTINYSDKYEFFVWSEYKIYQEEREKLLNANPKINPDNYIRWVAKDYGDGHGYDIQSIDLSEITEEIIEAKSGKSSEIDLTENEYETALESINIKYTDYYVQKLIYNKTENRIYRRVLKMNKNTGLFIDSNGISYYGNPYTMTDIETGEEKKLVGIVTEDQYNQIQANKRKIKEI